MYDSKDEHSIQIDFHFYSIFLGPSADSQERFGGNYQNGAILHFCARYVKIPIDNNKAGKMEDQFETGTQISSNNEVLTFSIFWRAKNYGKKFPRLSQTSFRGQKNTEKSGVRLNFDASSVLHPTSARSKTRSSPEYSTSENQFSEVFHSEFSVSFYTQNRKLGAENSELKTSELKTSEFSLRFTRTTIFLLNCVTSRILIKLRVFQLRGFVFALYPKPKLGDGKPRSLI